MEDLVLVLDFPLDFSQKRIKLLVGKLVVGHGVLCIENLGFQVLQVDPDYLIVGLSQVLPRYLFY